MTTKKRAESHSSTDSSSASTSGNSSSTSSSSGTGSDSSSSSDSESSSQEETKKSVPNTNEAKKSAEPPQKSHQPAKPQQSTNKSSKTVGANVSNNLGSKLQRLPKENSKSNIYSTDDDDDLPKNDMAAKRKIAKPKSTATVTPKVFQKVATKPSNRAPSKSTPKESSNTKAPPKASIVSKTVAKKNKKKSIFSPENSSAESDDASNVKINSVKTAKTSNQKPRTKASPRTLLKKPPVETKKETVKSAEVKVPTKTIIVSSASSNSSTSDSSSASDNNDKSDSDSSTNSSANSSGPQQRDQKSKKKQSPKDHVKMNDKVATKKLTRSSNARKSKHIVGKNSIFSDSDSDSESVKMSGRSPVKKPPQAKGTSKNKSKRKNNEVKPQINEHDERKCPVEGCDSKGHLGGRLDKHFTVEACLMYHNMIMNQAKEQLVERKKRDEIRKRGFDMYKKIAKSGHQPNAEHKVHLQKIKEIRSKFKNDLVVNKEDVKPCQLDKNKEPNLDKIVPDYDLKLFREAQAVASEKIEEDLKVLPNTKGTKYIEMGKFEMEVWYQSPYPEDYARLPKLYICEFCLRYMKSHTVLLRHVVKCVWRHPPGEEVYRRDKISVWEVDGKRYKQYCQNLCLLAKFFLDHKTLYYDVEPFLFYVMTMADAEGCHTVGYFSKEKNSFLNYNVSCILTLPPYQRQGYGRLLIDFSYLLTRVEGKIGSPEKPLSDLGLISYRSYWKDVLLGYLCSRAGTTLSVKDISQETAIHSYDIVSTLQALGMMKYWKGKHIILKKQDVLDEYVERVKRRGSLLKEVDPASLKWKPFVPPQPNPA